MKLKFLFKYRYFRNIINAYKKYKIPPFYKTIDQIDLSPVFILGLNRSGTSLLASIMNQHPGLEGLFIGNERPTYAKDTLHNIGYNESTHIWDWLSRPFYDNFNRKNIGDNILWGHSKYISWAHRDVPKNNKEILMLANSIERFRKTDKRPLIKDQFNLIRIGLIKKALPKAKFIFIVREYEDYFRSCKHKWFKENNSKKHRSIANHWAIGNFSAFCDLIEYAKDDFSIINFNELLSKKEYVQKTLSRTCSEIGLRDYEFDLKVIDKKFMYNKGMKISSSLDFNNISLKDILLEYQKVNDSL